MKILHVVKTAAGASWVYHQVRVLKSMGVDVVVAIPSKEEGFGRCYRQIGVEMIEANFDFPARTPWRLTQLAERFREIVKHVRPDVIHSNHVGTTLVMRAALKRERQIPRIFQVPGPLHLEHRFFARSEIASARENDYWIATCGWTQKKYEELGIARRRIFLSYAGTDIRPFTGARTGQLRAELGVSTETPLVGMVAYMYAPKWFVGQTRGLKGHEDFISAMELVRRKRPEVCGVVIGGAWNGAAHYERRVRAFAQRKCPGGVRFLGMRSDVASLYPDIDLAVVPSHSENCGGALEALLSGVPVVASKVGGLPELVREGETGWLAPPRNPEALAGTILAALSDREEARRRALQGEKIARRLFDVERTAREIAAIYKLVVSGRVKQAGQN
jgi:glycosyltransferase involved in cell wall biosynthesis